MQSLQKTIDYLNQNYPEIFTIADAKRGDIGNTSQKYAKCFFEQLNFDSITVNPYMGKDSVLPFLQYKNKITILLTLTSNLGKLDFQLSVPISSRKFALQLTCFRTRSNLGIWMLWISPRTNSWR